MKEEYNQSFTELEVWKKSRALKIELKDLSATFPPEEKFRLTDQIIRSSRSINTAIAEGFGRYNLGDQVDFCTIARGSASATYNHLIDALDCYYISIDQLKDFKIKMEEIEGLINDYISYLKKNTDK